MEIFHSLKELEKQVTRELWSVTQSSKNKIEQVLEDNVLDYYSIGSPQYVRTGALLTSPTTTDVKGNGKKLSFEAYMDEGIYYADGRYSGRDVINATEFGFGGTVGKHEYFQRTEDMVEDILEKEFDKHFK